MVRSMIKLMLKKGLCTVSEIRQNTEGGNEEIQYQSFNNQEVPQAINSVSPRSLKFSISSNQRKNLPPKQQSHHLSQPQITTNPNSKKLLNSAYRENDSDPKNTDTSFKKLYSDTNQAKRSFNDNLSTENEINTTGGLKKMKKSANKHVLAQISRFLGKK